DTSNRVTTDCAYSTPRGWWFYRNSAAAGLLRGKIMRSTLDRIRHAVCFEIIGVLIVTPSAGWAFSAQFDRVGVLAIAMSMIATVWNYVYNLIFDHLMLRWRGRVHKHVAERVVHALIFEF